MLKKELEEKVAKLEGELAASWRKNTELQIEIEELRRDIADRRGEPRPWPREIQLAATLERLLPRRLRRKLRKALGEDFLADLPKSWKFLHSA